MTDNVGEGATRAVTPILPNADEWDLIRSSDFNSIDAQVIVVIPVYKGRIETIRCVHSVLANANETKFRLMVINDSSPDAALVAELDNLSQRFGFELLHNAVNQGFVKTCNIAFNRATDADILLLNSDTQVFGNWLDRMRETAYRDPRIGTVTPFSNNAEICSYPQSIANNWAALELTDSELDSLAASVNAGEYVDIPTGVGFCMYIRGDCRRQVGLFDEDSFGKGYGEENDFCRRAVTLAWRNVLCADVFVRHYGGASFGQEKRALAATGFGHMERLHPGYLQAVGAWLERDPALPFRRALDIARLQRHSKGEAILFVTHAWGGGTERHVQGLRARLESEGVPSFVCRPNGINPELLTFGTSKVGTTPNLDSFNIRRDLQTFASTLERLGVRHIHVHHWLGFIPEVMDFIAAVASLLDIRYDVTVHDYAAICPRINLIDQSGHYCGEPDLTACERCVERDSSPFGAPSVWEWRTRSLRVLSQARRVIAPDQDVAERYSRHFPNLPIHVRPHEAPICDEPTPLGSRRAFSKRIPGHRRIGLLGAIGPHKGSSLIVQTAMLCKAKDIPLTFVIIGYTDRDHLLLDIGNVEISGAYAESEAPQLIAEADLDFMWFSSVCPETFSFTLTQTFSAKVFPVAFNLGAISRRIKEARWGTVLPLELMWQPDALSTTLASVSVVPWSSEASTPETRYAAPILRSYYAIDDNHEQPAR